MSPQLTKKRSRIAGVDLARALAALIMIQGHATHAWVAEAHQGFSYRISRMLGTLPLPGFLLLAGVSVVLRYDLARARSEDLRVLRRRLMKRGGSLVAVGYAVSALSALTDGGGWNAALRADVLQVIGLSIAISATLLRGPLSAAVRRIAWIGLFVTILSPLVPTLMLPIPMAAIVGLFVDIAPITRMPVVPLYAWFAIGGVVGASITRRQTEGGTAFAVLRTGLMMALAGSWATSWVRELVPGAFDRRHVAIVFNVLDLGGRGMSILGAGLVLAPRIPTRWMTHLNRLGRGSLTAYIVHIPFCYGFIGAPIRNRLSMMGAAIGAFLLMFVSYAAVYLKERFIEMRRT